jgi:hypothetical protein
MFRETFFVFLQMLRYISKYQISGYITVSLTPKILHN